MEKTQTFFEGICDLCQIPHNQIEPISFTCNHNLCLNCLPYLFYNSIQHSLFIYELKECPCPFCENGYTKLPFQDLMTKISYPPPIYESQSKISSLRCDYCENESSLICNDCQMNYCTNCLTSFHNNLKKNKSHHMVTHEIKEKNSVFKCGCEQNKPAKNFCKTCKIARIQSRMRHSTNNKPGGLWDPKHFKWKRNS